MTFNDFSKYFFSFRIVSLDFKSFNDMGIGDIFNPSFRGGMILDCDIKNHLIGSTRGSFTSRILSQRLYSKMCGLEFPENHPFLEIFDRKTNQLFTAGLIDYFKTEIQHLEYNAESGGPQVLSINHLRAGLVTWFVSIWITVFAFICEWLFILKEYFLIKYILTAFYNQRKESSKIRSLTPEMIKHLNKPLIVAISNEENDTTSVETKSLLNKIFILVQPVDVNRNGELNKEEMSKVTAMNIQSSSNVIEVDLKVEPRKF